MPLYRFGEVLIGPVAGFDLHFGVAKSTLGLVIH